MNTDKGVRDKPRTPINSTVQCVSGSVVECLFCSWFIRVIRAIRGSKCMVPAKECFHRQTSPDSLKLGGALCPDTPAYVTCLGVKPLPQRDKCWRIRFPGFAAFSLVEVIIAVGIFAAAVAVILALLPALTRQAAGSADTLAALRLPDALRTELQRVATTGGFDALAGQTRPMTAPLPDTLTLVASRAATRVQTLDYLPPPAAELLGVDEQYFLLEVWSFNQAPLAFDASGSVLALHIRVSWPYHIPGSSTATPSTGREQATFNLALNR